MHYKFTKFELILFLLSAFFIVWAVISLLYVSGWSLWFETTSLDHIGSFIAGVLAILNLYYLIRTLIEQHRQNAIGSFESNFLELVKFCRGQLAEIEIADPDSSGNEVLRGKNAISSVFNQIESAYGIVNAYIQDRKLKDLYANDDIFRRQQALWKDNHKVRLAINLAYLIVYVGVKNHDLKLLKHKYLEEYQSDFIEDLLTQFRMVLSKRAPNELQVKGGSSFQKSQVLQCNDKYYQGFQNELGNYFRMLYQAVTFVDSHNLTYQQKYKYIKMLRGQMSIMEECVLFYNSLSNLGLAWEIANENTNDYLITKYNLIKNIPNSFCKVNQEAFYPNVYYEYLSIEPQNRHSMKFS